MNNILKKGDRVAMTFTHVDTGEEKVVEGTITSDEIQFFDWVSVQWDNRPILSMFPVSVYQLNQLSTSDIVQG